MCAWEMMTGSQVNFHSCSIQCSQKFICFIINHSVGLTRKMFTHQVHVAKTIHLISALSQLHATHSLSSVRYNLWLNNVTEASSCEDLLRSSTPRTACVLNRAISTAGRRHVSVSFNVSESQNAVVTGGSKSDDQSSLRVQAASIDDVLHLVDGTRLPILLLKMDCEGCEFDALPSLGARFADNATIRAFAGEIHQTLLVDRKWLKQHHKSFDTVAPQRTDDEKSALRTALRLRGCETTAWRVHC